MSQELRERIAARRQARAVPPPSTLPSRRATPSPADDEERGGWLPTAIRVASGLIPNPIAGAVAGAGGELAAQRAEHRDDINWTQVMTQGALGAIPFRTAGKALWSMIKGGGKGALMSTASEGAEQFGDGEFDAGRLVTAAGMGGVLGSAGGALVHKIAGRRAARAVDAPPAVDTAAPVARPGLDPAKIGGPEHAADVIRRVRARRGQIRYPRGTPAAEVLAREPVPEVGRLPDDLTEAQRLLQTRLTLGRGAASGPSGSPSLGTTDPTLPVRDTSVPSRAPSNGPDPETVPVFEPDPLPRRRLQIGRGVHGNVAVTFPDELHKNLYAAWGRSRRAITQQGTRGAGFSDAPSAENFEGIARQLGVTPVEAQRLAQEYRESINRAIRREVLGEATEYEAPRLGSREPSTPAAFDAPLTPEELARAAEPTPPPTRPSPAARRRARRAKLEAAIREAGGGGTKPRYTAEQVAAYRRAAGYEDLAPDDLPSLEQARTRFPSLPESHLRTLLDKYAFERTQIETPQRPKLGFDDFVRHERKVLEKADRIPELDDRWDVLTDPNSERGAISQDLLFDIASPAAGAVIGAPLGAYLDDDDQVGMVGGAAAGALAGMALRRPSALATLQYGSMLSSPITMLKGTTGSAGSVLMNALERGDLGTVARNALSKQTLDAAKAGFKAGGAPGRYRSGTSGAGSLYNPLRFPGRVLGAADEAAKDVLVRSGRTPQEAAEEVLTGTPRSRLGKGLLKAHFKTGAVGEVVLPFARTIMNALERGMEATPGVGFLPSVRKMRGLTLEQAAKKQGLGAIAAMIAAAAGEQSAEAPEGSWERRLWDVAPIAAGPMAVPAGLAYVASRAAQSKDASPHTVSSAVVRGFQDTLPTPEIPSLREMLQRAIPRDLSEATGGDSPSVYDTRDSHFAPLVARIPGLNEYLLRRKSTGRPTTSATRSRPARVGRASRSRER